jgi:hypothetical protein
MIPLNPRSTRTWLAALAVLGVGGLAAGCPASIQPSANLEFAAGVGDPCVAEEEYDPSFLGFSLTEISIDDRNFQCPTRICLVNHFQGRASCPYGQNVDGTPRAPAAACTNGTPRPDGVGVACAAQTAQAWGCCAPGSGAPISGWDPTCQGLVAGSPYDAPCPDAGSPGACDSRVLGQCTQRKADTAVYCSCRCADQYGQTSDGSEYCICPGGFTCTQLVYSLGDPVSPLTGAYCIKNGTAYPDAGVDCTECDPATGDCE